MHVFIKFDLFILEYRFDILIHADLLLYIVVCNYFISLAALDLTSLIDCSVSISERTSISDRKVYIKFKHYLHLLNVPELPERFIDKLLTQEVIHF
jgi:hypothetical protein